MKLAWLIWWQLLEVNGHTWSHFLLISYHWSISILHENIRNLRFSNVGRGYRIYNRIYSSHMWSDFWQGVIFCSYQYTFASDHGRLTSHWNILTIYCTQKKSDGSFWGLFLACSNWFLTFWFHVVSTKDIDTEKQIMLILKSKNSEWVKLQMLQIKSTRFLEKKQT